MAQNMYVEQLKKDKGPDVKMNLRDLMYAQDYEILGQDGFKALIDGMQYFPGVTALRVASTHTAAP